MMDVGIYMTAHIVRPAARKRPVNRHRVREPRQARARQTVEAVLDAVSSVLRREGVEGLTTNKIAVRAGVSIGSVYQYFADKRAILIAVRDRHVDRMGHLIERTLVECAGATLEDLMRGLIEAAVRAHALDPELYELLLTQLPRRTAHRSGGAESRLKGALRLALAAHARELGRSFEIERALFVSANMIESLVHGAVLDRPPTLTLAGATDEIVRAVLAYLRSAGEPVGRQLAATTGKR